MNRDPVDLQVLADAMRQALLGEEIGTELIETAEKVVAAGMLPAFGRVALTVLMEHRMRHLLTRRAVILASVGRPPYH